jgi:transcriptional regulator with XRE-family HTH domain
MRRRQVNQRQLAERIGVDPSAVSRWVSGRQAPEARYLRALAISLETSSDYLLGIVSAKPEEGPVDLAVVIQTDDWLWGGRRVTPETRRRVRGILWFALAPADQWPQLPTIVPTTGQTPAGDDAPRENGNRPGVTVVFTRRRRSRLGGEGVGSGGEVGGGDHVG